MKNPTIEAFEEGLLARQQRLRLRGRGRVAFRDPGELELGIRTYFERCHKNGEPPSIIGLANALGVSPRTLLDYGEKEKFAYIVEAAKMAIAAEVEGKLWNRETLGGAKFWLQTVLKWVPATATEVSGPDKGPVQVQPDYDADLARLAAMISPPGEAEGEVTQ